MNTEQREANGFEERLLVELRREVVARAASSTPQAGRTARPRVPFSWRRRLALTAAVAVVLGAGAAVGIPMLSGTEAYAVTSNGDGTVTVEINDLSDAAGLEQKLREAGVPAVIRYLPAGKACKEGWFTPWQGQSGPVTGGVGMGSGGSGEGSPKFSPARFTIDRSSLPADVTLVITTQNAPAAEGAGRASSIGIAFAQGEVGECEVVDAPANGPAIPAPASGGGGAPESGTSSVEEDQSGPSLNVSDASG